MKPLKQFFVLIVVAFVGLAVVGCKPDPIPTETFTVSFNANGGIPTPETQIVEKGKTAKEPTAPTKENSDLDDWYKESALTTKWNFATDTVTANIELFAGWLLKNKSITITGLNEFENKYGFVFLYTNLDPQEGVVYSSTDDDFDK